MVIVVALWVLQKQRVILQAYNIPFLDDNLFEHLLLYGNEKFKYEENQKILKATIKKPFYP